MNKLSESQRNEIKSEIAGKSGKVRTGCPHCDGAGGQEKTMEVRTDDGYFFCYRCKLAGYLDGPERNPTNRPSLPAPAKKDQDPLQKAKWIWNHAESIHEGDTGHTYLSNKKVPALGGIRLYKEALLIPLRAPGQKEIKALQFIKSDGSKVFLKGCSKKGAALIIGTLDAALCVCIAEGFATGASVHQATGFPVFCAMDSGNLKPVSQVVRQMLPDVKIIFASDNDRNKKKTAPGYDEGFKCASDAARAIDGKISMPEKPGQDFNDLFVDSGPEVVKTAIAGAIDPPPANHPELKNKNKKTDSSGPDSRPEIRIIAGRLHDQIEQAESVLVDSKEEIYSLGSDFLVRPISAPAGKNYGVVRPAGQTVWCPVTISYLVYLLTLRIQFLKYDGRAEDWVPTDCPKKIAEGVLSRAGKWRFPIVSGLAHSPFVRWDGSVLSRSGYDPKTGIFVNFNSKFPSVPEHPCRQDAEAALLRLREAVKTFSFDGPISESVAICGMITAVMRPAINQAPVLLVTASTAGSGKGMLVDGFSILAHGVPVAVSSADQKAEELQAVLESLLLEGSPMISIDNLEKPLKSARLCQIVSQESISIRIKGFSKTATVTPSCFVCVTGNNAAVSGDLNRRTIVCCIDPGCERPEQRKFKQSFQDYVRKNRGEMVQDILIILRAWFLSDCPDQDIPPAGSFEMWSRWCRSPLVFLGLPDPWSSQEKIRDEDISLLNLKTLFQVWWETFGASSKTPKEAVRRAMDAKGMSNDSLYDALELVAGDAKKPNGICNWRLGNYFRRHKNRILGTLQLVTDGKKNRAVRWAIMDRSKVDDKPPEGSTDTHDGSDPFGYDEAISEDSSPTDQEWDGQGSIEI